MARGLINALGPEARPSAKETPIDPYEAVRRRVLEFTRLRKNWDTYGGVPPSPATRSRSMDLLTEWAAFARKSGGELPPPFAAPCGSGSIQFEWSLGNRDVEIEITGNNSVKWLVASKADADSVGEFQDILGEQAKQIVRWLISDK